MSRGGAPRWARAAPATVKGGEVVRRAIGRRIKLDGYSFDSFGEARRYEELKQLLIAGAIEWLKVHPRYKLEVNGVEICTYIADFEYRDRSKPIAGGFALVIEDYKEWTVSSSWKIVDGKPKIRKSKNPDWRVAELKIKLLEALTGARVVIIGDGRGAS